VQPPELKPAGGEQSFAGLMDDDEDHVPTQIKRPGQIAGGDDGEAPSLLPVGGIPDADDDGPTNLPAPTSEFEDEVSVDLSDHLHLGPDAVKEAVRQSRLMPSADAGQKAASTTAKPVELSDKRAQVSKPVEPVSDVDAGGETSRAGLVVLILVLMLVAAAGAVYALNLFDVRARLGLAEPARTTMQDPAQDTEHLVEPSDDRQELPSAKLVLGDAPVIKLEAESNGVLAKIVESGTAVKEGDEVAMLKGTEAIDKKLAEHRERQNFYQARLNKVLEQKAQAEKAGNAAQARKHQTEADKHQQKVDEKRNLAEAEEQKLEPFRLKAPAEGVVETSLKGGAAFNAGDVLLTIKGAPALQGTFTIANNEYAQAAEVEIVAKADDKKRLDCRVVEARGERVTVECPGEGGLSADDEVILRP
jgi:biotin carboxyl carrier protein